MPAGVQNADFSVRHQTSTQTRRKPLVRGVQRREIRRFQVLFRVRIVGNDEVSTPSGQCTAHTDGEILASGSRIPLASGLGVRRDLRFGENLLVFRRLHQVSHLAGHHDGQIRRVRRHNHLVVGVSPQIPSRVVDGNHLRLTHTGCHRHRDPVFVPLFHVHEQPAQAFEVQTELVLGVQRPDERQKVVLAQGHAPALLQLLEHGQQLDGIVGRQRLDQAVKHGRSKTRGNFHPLLRGVPRP